jgi:tetratricopeptide (TPR) repeat protein
MPLVTRTDIYWRLAVGIAILLMVAFTEGPVCAQDTLWHTWRNGGILAMQEGRLGDAERLFIAAMEQAEKFGADDLRVAEAANDLAVVYATTGKSVEAELLFQRALLIAGHTMGADHPGVGTISQNLGILYATLQRYQDAEPLLKHALEINLKRFGTDHIRTALTLKTLSSFYAAQGQLAEAEQLIQKSLAILEARQVKRNDPQLTETLEIFAAILRHTNREREAREVEQRLQAGEIVYQ